MNKAAIKNFAVWARNKLIADIEYKAGLMGITEKGIADPLPQSNSEVQFFDIGTKDYAAVRGEEIHQRGSFVSAIRAKEREVGHEAAFRFIVEKVAYTWFNRLIAIRFMEVNDYLPSRVRVLSSENESKAEPDMVTKPLDMDMEFSRDEQDFIMRLKDENRLDELFRWLFIRQCDKLHEVLPLLFDAKSEGDRKNDYLELLLTISFTDKDGVLWHLVHDIKERDFRIRTPEDEERQKVENIPDDEMPAGQVEIIGWIYQYYNTEPKDRVFADLKKNIKISKDKIPAATQLFTPDWIVRYMVENSVGRIFVHGELKKEYGENSGESGSEEDRIAREKAIAQSMGWDYYLPEAPQEPEVRAILDSQCSIPDYSALRCIDPCMGSGHILVCLFDVLMQIYENQGWTRREAAQSIVQNNLYGLDIDERAAQLAYFAVMMKARQYDRRFLERSIEPHVYEIRESNELNSDYLKLFGDLQDKAKALFDEMRDAKTYGSILRLSLSEKDIAALRERLEDIKETKYDNFFDLARQNGLVNVYAPLLDVAEGLSRKYDVVVTNPPYMGSSGMGPELSKYVKDNYPDSKSDLFAVMIERCMNMTKRCGYQAMITQHAWMFLSSFEKLRAKLQTVDTVNMAHLGARAFEEIGGEVVQTTSFVFCNEHTRGFKGTYCRLVEPTTQKGKQDMFLAGENRYVAQADYFSTIPGTPVAYWVSKTVMQSFDSKHIEDYSRCCKGLDSGDNNRFLRLWFEVSDNRITFQSMNGDNVIWVPHNKGGQFRKWYGNRDYIINWTNNGKEIKCHPGARPQNLDSFFIEAFTWSTFSSGEIAFRYLPKGSTSDSKGSIGIKSKDLMYILGYLNSKVCNNYMHILAPTLDFSVGAVKRLPFKYVNSEKVCQFVKKSIESCKEDWDSFETSWDFQRHPLIPQVQGVWDSDEAAAAKAEGKPLSELPPRLFLSATFDSWNTVCESRFQKLKANEEALNRIFIDIYGLQDELTPEVEEKDVTVRRADLQRDIKSLLSYAVGCMFGRYSISKPGLQFAGGDWAAFRTSPQFAILNSPFSITPDNCILITDEPYFEDDIVGRFVEFIRVVYGAETLEENLAFIAKALGNKGNSSREVIRNYFLNDFFKDHCSTYSVTGSGKRPIYWLFDSGKQNGFKALIYMHRWDADTVGKLRVEYLHKVQRVYEKEIERMQDMIENGASSREISQATKRREKLVKQLKEARDYDARIAHAALSRVEIDLDDGVKINYEKVQKGPDGKSLGILAKI